MWRGPTLLLVAWTLLLAGCGFQLRGTGALPESVTVLHLSGDGLTLALGRALREELAGAGARLVDSPGQARARLDIAAFEETRRVLSYNAAGAVHETELSSSVTFRVIDAGGAELIPPRRLEAHRDLRVDDGTPAEVAAKERGIRRELLDELAEQLRRQLAAAS